MKRLCLTALLTIASCAPVHAQGCSQCAESVGQTPARTQQAYRRAIAVMIVAATCICGATILVIRRYR